MTARIWNSGPPPHIGWWLCWSSSTIAWRWWNGKRFSFACDESRNAKEAAHWAQYELFYGNEFFKWTDYWPENARVPRIKPCTEELKNEKSDQSLRV